MKTSAACWPACCSPPRPAPPGPVRPMAMLADEAATPVSAGELTVRVEVSGVFELAK